jgi:hypothetical protein
LAIFQKKLPIYFLFFVDIDVAEVLHCQYKCMFNTKFPSIIQFKIIPMTDELAGITN